MSKTPEQMAEELADQWSKRDTNHWRDIKGAFVSGYVAAKDEQLFKEKEDIEKFKSTELYKYFFGRSEWADMIERSKKDK